MQTRSEELLALKDKANLALGFALLAGRTPGGSQAHSAARAARGARIRARRCSESVGRTPASVQFKRALVPWLALRKRSLLDSAVQESFLTVPYAYAQLSATGQAADYYNSAIALLRQRAEADRRFDRTAFAAASCSSVS